MEKKLELIEIGENHFTISGTYYMNGKYELTTPRDLQDTEVRVECLDLVYKIRDFFNLNLTQQYIRQELMTLSENREVALYQLLFEKKLLDSRIIDLRAGKEWEIGLHRNDIIYIHRTHRTEQSDAQETPTVPIEVLTYGYSNKITIFVGIETFIKIAKENKLPNQDLYVRIFKRQYGINIETESVENFINTMSDIGEFKKIKQKYDVIVRELESEKVSFVTKYFKKKYPGLEEGNYVLSDNDIIKITDTGIYEYKDREITHAIEKEYYFSARGHIMTAAGPGKKICHVNEHKYSVICTQSEYEVKQNKKATRNTLLKILEEKIILAD